MTSDLNLRVNGFEGFVLIWRKYAKIRPSKMTFGTLKTLKLFQQPRSAGIAAELGDPVDSILFYSMNIRGSRSWLL